MAQLSASFRGETITKETRNTLHSMVVSPSLSPLFLALSVPQPCFRFVDLLLDCTDTARPGVWALLLMPARFLHTRFLSHFLSLADFSRFSFNVHVHHRRSQVFAMLTDWQT